MKHYLKAYALAIMIIINNQSSADLRLKDKVAVITGASRGIGVEIAKLFAKEGAKVVLLSRTENDLKKVVADIEKNNGIASYIVGDVSCHEDLQKMASFAVNKYKRIDILVHNAGRYDDLACVDEMSQET
jgi:3-oxoacyl-[acyl-carrier protein] reductase